MSLGEAQKAEVGRLLNTVYGWRPTPRDLSVKLLMAISNNVLDEPENRKFRRLDLEKLKAKFANPAESLALIKTMGFVPNAENTHLEAVRAVYDMIVSKDKEFAKLEEAKADARAAAAAAADKKDAKAEPVKALAEEDSKSDTDDTMVVKPDASSAPTDSRTALQREVTQLLSFEIGKQKFDTAALFKQFPVTFSNRNKQLLFALCSGLTPGDPHPPSGQLTVTRWSQFPLPENYPQASIARPLEPHVCTVDLRQDVFTYDQPAPGAVDWHLNFAHSHLFTAWDSSLFAQDEMQVCEHPSLAALALALRASSTSASPNRVLPLTVEGGKPTPVLIRGAERRCAVATDANAEQGRPFGLYGNAWSRGSPDAVRKATTVLRPPTITNLVAIEAPHGYSGVYRRETILWALNTLYTAFTAARIESYSAHAEAKAAAASASASAPATTTTTAASDTKDAKAETKRDLPIVTIHTGNWGTGAYGGNRVLMAALQLLAARLARVDRLVYHSFDSVNSNAFREAGALMDALCGSGSGPVSVASIVTKLYEKRFEWGFGDGN